MLVDILLLGGPEDGSVRQINPEFETNCVVIDVQTEIAHKYYVEMLTGHARVWGVGIHESLFRIDDEFLADTIIERLVTLYVEKSASKAEIPTRESQVY